MLFLIISLVISTRKIPTLIKIPFHKFFADNALNNQMRYSVNYFKHLTYSNIKTKPEKHE